MWMGGGCLWLVWLDMGWSMELGVAGLLKNKGISELELGWTLTKVGNIQRILLA